MSLTEPSSPAPVASAESPPAEEVHGESAHAAEKEKEKAPTTRFIVERRTRGLLLSERTGCVLATGVAVIPLAVFSNFMVPLLQQESGFMLLLLSITMALGACVSIFVGLAISVFVWWLPRMMYLALHTKVRRTGVRAGVRSRGLWVSGLGWMGWNGMHVREKGARNAPCATLVIKTSEQGELLLHSTENVPDLLRQIRRYMDAQATEFQTTELMPSSRSA